MASLPNALLVEAYELGEGLGMRMIERKERERKKELSL